jgi:hypothetical protein
MTRGRLMQVCISAQARSDGRVWDRGVVTHLTVALVVCFGLSAAGLDAAGKDHRPGKLRLRRAHPRNESKKATRTSGPYSLKYY